MASRPERVILTYEDYLALPDDCKRYQLFEGEIDVTPAPGTFHQLVLKRFAAPLDRYVSDHNLGTVLFAPCDVVLSDTTVVQPDVLFVARESKAVILPQHVRGPPDLVVEILSPTTARADRFLKRQLYARYGVPHYWRVDPERKEIVCDRLEGNYYIQVIVAGQEDVLRPALFPDLSIPLAILWE